MPQGQISIQRKPDHLLEMPSRHVQPVFWLTELGRLSQLSNRNVLGKRRISTVSRSPSGLFRCCCCKCQRWRLGDHCLSRRPEQQWWGQSVLELSLWQVQRRSGGVLAAFCMRVFSWYDGSHRGDVSGQTTDCFLRGRAHPVGQDKRKQRQLALL